MKREITLMELVLVLVFLLGFVGWVKDVVRFASCDFEAPYKAEIVYGAGLIPPIGAITGWLDVGV